MKLAFVVIFIVALCSHVCVVSCAPSSSTLAPLPGTVTSTTAKPWTQKFKDGLGKFFQGAAIAGAVQQGIQNARSHKHKPLAGSTPLAAKAVH